MRILIVEDDFSIQRLAQKIIEPFGDCEIVENGLQCIETIKTAYEKQDPYTVIFLDIMMPVKDGQTVLQEIRDWEYQQEIWGSKALKIIMMTALGDNKNILQAFRSQCEGYIVKPITHDKIVSQLEALKLINNQKPIVDKQK